MVHIFTKQNGATRCVIQFEIANIANKCSYMCMIVSQFIEQVDDIVNIWRHHIFLAFCLRNGLEKQLQVALMHIQELLFILYF